MGSETPGQLRLSSRAMQRSTVNGCTLADDSSKLGGTIPLQAIIGLKLKKTQTQTTVFQEFMALQIGWQEEEVVKLNNK